MGLLLAAPDLSRIRSQAHEAGKRDAKAKECDYEDQRYSDNFGDPLHSEGQEHAPGCRNAETEEAE